MRESSAIRVAEWRGLPATHTMTDVAKLRLLGVGGLAWMGIVLGHVLAYLLAYPEDGARSAKLAATGHDGFSLPVVSALAVLPAVLALVSGRRFRGHRSSLKPTALWLAAIQVPAFVGMESIERAWADGHTLLDPAILLGLLVQLLVAAVAAVLVGAVAKVVRVLTRERTHAPRDAAAPPDNATQREVSHRLTFLIRARRRAPPSVFAE